MLNRIIAAPLALLILALAPAAALAGPIYDVNRTIGAGSVIGTIETDGTIGLLTTVNILSFSLTVDDGDGAGPFVIDEPGNADVLVGGSLLTATAGDIFFNFSGNGGFALFQNPNIGSGQNWWCVEGIASGCAGSGSSTESVNRFGGPTFVVHQGNVSIASRAVPEPVSLTLLGLGFAAAGWRRARQSR